MKINKILAILTVFTISGLFAIKPKTPEEIAKMQKSQPTYLERLPTELRVELTKFVISGKDLDEIVKNIKHFVKDNPTFYTGINQPENMKSLIQAIANRVSPIDEQEVAARLYSIPELSGIQDKTVQLWLTERIMASAPEQQLIFAAQTDDINNTENLLGILPIYKGNINAVDQTAKNTALMYAAKNHNLEIVKKLLAAGANVNQRNLDNRTALYFAKAYGENTAEKAAVIKLLQEHGAQE